MLNPESGRPETRALPVTPAAGARIQASETGTSFHAWSLHCFRLQASVCRDLRSISQPVDPRVLRAAGTTEDVAVVLDPVTDDPALAALALGCERMDGALEAVVHVPE